MKQPDRDIRRGISKALESTLGLIASPLLIDKAADAAFASSLERLRGEPGTQKGGTNERAS